MNFPEQKILGHVFTRKGRLPDPALIRTIIDLQRPTTIEQVQSLLGLVQVSREYILLLSTIIDPKRS